MQFQRIHIELTNNCNFSCQFCPDSLMTRKRGQIDFNLLSKAVDEISQEKLTDLVLFHVMGEPTLYPDLEKAVRYTKSKGLRVHLTTNGSLLNERLLNTLLGSDIDHILFSVQTPDERSFSLRHAKIDFHEYKRQIVSCVTKLLEQNVNTVATLSFLTSPFKWLTLPSKRFSTIDNKKSLVTHINCWMKDILIGIENVAVKREILSGFDDLRKPILKSNLLGWNRFKVTNKLFIETRPIGDWIHPSLFTDKIHKAKIGSCEGLRQHFGILCNGDMVFCCVDFDGRTAFANIGEKTIKEALQNREVQKAITDFERLRINHPYCQKCLGDVSWSSSLARQVGSIFYFKWYRKHWWLKRDLKEAETHA